MINTKKLISELEAKIEKCEILYAKAIKKKQTKCAQLLNTKIYLYSGEIIALQDIYNSND